MTRPGFGSRLAGISQLLCAKASRKSLAILVSAFALTQFVTVFLVSAYRELPLADFLKRWDAGWYIQIAESGYSGPAWAFFPVYPMMMRGMSLVSGVPVPFAGLIVSALALLAAVFVYTRHVAGRRGRFEFPAGSNLGWFLFLFSPASWVFLHPHTESLYVLLLVLTLACWVRSRWLVAALFSGLAALTKNQGTFLALTSGLAAAHDVYLRHAGVANGKGRGWRDPVLIFLACGAISGGIYALYPLYQYALAGDPFLYLSSQIHWRPEMTAASYFKTLWFGNPWQNLRPGSLLHHAFFFALIYTVFVYARRYPRNLIWIYFALHTAVMPMSGELVGNLRYGTVLIVLWLFLGDQIANKIKSSDAAFVAVASIAAILHQAFLVSAIVGRWAY
jgi:hypothetical protein